MYINRVPNGNSPPAVLLRESYREGKKVKKRTLANLSKLPDEVVNNLQQILKGAKAVNPQQLPELLQVVRSLPHGHVAVILNSIKQLQIDTIIDPQQSRQRNLILAMIVARIINPASKLATVRGFHGETATSSIGQVLGIEKATANELYDALDWLVVRQEKIENNLAQKHLQEGSLILYHSFATLLADLGTITTNKIKFNLQGQRFSFEKITQPTTLQQKALDLAGVSLICTQ